MTHIRIGIPNDLLKRCVLNKIKIVFKSVYINNKYL